MWTRDLTEDSAKEWRRRDGQLRTGWSGSLPQAPGHSARPRLCGTCPGWSGQVDGGLEGGSRWRRGRVMDGLWVSWFASERCAHR